jgi:hypothetical protein
MKDLEECQFVCVAFPALVQHQQKNHVRAGSSSDGKMSGGARQANQVLSELGL